MSEEQKDKEPTSQRNNETSSYRSIFKATSLFGGVQVYQILISIIKAKFIAILLGPAGVGIQGLFTSATQLIQGLSSFGLKQSAIKNVSESYSSGDIHKVSIVVTVLRRLVWLTGLLGMLLVICFSKHLSQATFGNNDYVVPFIILSLTLLLDQLSAGQKVILQGTRRLKDLAKASALGATFGLIISVPLYYLLGIKGIVPTLVLHSVAGLLLSWYFSKRIKIEHVTVNKYTVVKEGKGMLQMGIAMSVSGVLVYLSSYVLRSFIRMEGGVDAVGLFTAGFTLMGSYAGLVFTAMATDYYPRLAAVNKDNEKCREIMNQQGEIGILILAPIMCACVIFSSLVIKILYSANFLGANAYIIWCAIGMLFKMASWSVSFVFVAKGESRLFIINEISSSVYFLGSYLLGYHIGGLAGLGMSFTVGYIIYTIQVYIISHIRYYFSFSSSFVHLFIIHLLFVTACLIVTLVFNSVWEKYIIGSFLFILSAVYSFIGLDKRIGLMNFINRKFGKRNV